MWHCTRYKCYDFSHLHGKGWRVNGFVLYTLYFYFSMLHTHICFAQHMHLACSNLYVLLRFDMVGFYHLGRAIPASLLCNKRGCNKKFKGILVRRVNLDKNYLYFGCVSLEWHYIFKSPKYTSKVNEDHPSFLLS